jgi:hypothetical protein
MRALRRIGPFTGRWRRIACQECPDVQSSWHIATTREEV